MLNIIKNYIIVTWKRLVSNTPRYWRRLSAIGLILTGFSAFLAENNDIIPEEFKPIVRYIAVAAGAATLVSRFATTNEELSRKSEDLLLKENSAKKLENI